MTSRIAFTVVGALLLVQAVTLHLLGRVWICTCGTIRLWVGDIHSPELSQQILDWYTPSHIIHGILFYGLLRLLLPRTPVPVRLAIAVGLEVAWEIAENSPAVIEEYRKQALAAGYVGDSILNSLMDTVSMIVGFMLARLLPWQHTVVLAIIAEVTTGVLVRDNLTLNILNFIHRFPAIDEWQRGA